MNRILTADVILTLTLVDVLTVWLALSDLHANTYERDEIVEIDQAMAVVKAQCAKQGLEL